jgi:hypothetical protein
LPTGVAADDHGNDFETASPIGLHHGTIEGRIDAVDDIDMFKIDLADASPGEIRVGLSRWFSGMKPFLAVYDPDGSLITWRDDAKVATGLAIVIQPGEKRHLYVTVEDAGSAGTGDYHLSVDNWNPSGPLWQLVSVSTNRSYSVGTAEKGALTYIDRNYRIRDISTELKNGDLLLTANDDKYLQNSRHLELELLQSVDLYVCYDKRGASDPPEWLTSNGWMPTSATVATADRGASPYRVFHKRVDPGELILGGNQDGARNGAHSNYFLIAKPAAAETADPKVVELIYTSNDQPYQLGIARRGAHPYIDRNYSIRSISRNLDQGLLIQTANDDKYLDAEVHLVMYFHESAEVFLCYDGRGRELPFWLVEGEWQPVQETLKTFDYPASPMQVFKQHVDAETELAVGGNLAGDARGAHSNYFLIIQPDDRAGGNESANSLTGGMPREPFGSGEQTDQVTEPGQWRWAEHYYGYQGIDRIRWQQDGCGKWHNYVIGWHQNDLVEYLMKFGGPYNKLVLRGIADKPGPVELAVYIDGEPVATVELDGNDDCSQDVTVAVDHIDFGTHAVAVQFVNDRYRKNQFDRNMYLDALRVIE